MQTIATNVTHSVSLCVSHTGECEPIKTAELIVSQFGCGFVWAQGTVY